MTAASNAERLDPEAGRSAERHRRIGLAALASASAKVISVATALISVPLTLRYLGPERYGMWVTISSLVSVLSFADLGIGNGLLTAVASAHGREDRQAIRVYVSSAFAVLTAIAAILIAAMAVAYPFIPWDRVFNVTGELARRESGPALATFAVGFALAIPTGIVQRVQMGLQSGFVASLWQCLGSVLALGGVLVAIRLEAGLPWLVLAFVGAPLLASLLNSLVFFGRYASDIRPRLRLVERPAVARVARTGILFLVLQITVSLAFASDSLVIAQVLGAPAVAEYAVPEKLFGLITVTLAMALAPLWPAYGEAIARGDHAWVRSTLKRSLLTAIGTAALLSGVMVVAAPTLIGLWVGHAVDPPFLLLLALGIWKVVEAGGNALAAYLNGAKVVKLQVIVAATLTVCAIAMKLILIRYLGISGVVWATIVSYIAIAPLPFAVAALRTLRHGEHRPPT